MGELFDSVFLIFLRAFEVVLEIIFYGRFVGKKRNGNTKYSVCRFRLRYHQFTDRGVAETCPFYSCPILLRYLGAKQQQRDGNSLCHTDSGDHAALLWRF